MANDALLSVRGITVRFGGVVALDSVSFDVPHGGVCGLIGPNGAGKTTLFNCLSRLYSYQEGDLLFEGKSITATPVHEIASLGIGRTFQNLAMFRTMSVERNVMIGAHCRSGSGFFSSALWLPSVRAEEQRLRARAHEIMSYLKLEPYAQRAAGDLPFGIQKRVEFARALAADPKLLLLDEPVAGVPEGERQEIFDIVNALPAEVTVLLIEHDMDLVFNFARTVSVLVNGALFAEGDVQSISNDPRVKAVYLGEGTPHG